MYENNFTNYILSWRKMDKNCKSFAEEVTDIIYNIRNYMFLHSSQPNLVTMPKPTVSETAFLLREILL